MENLTKKRGKTGSNRSFTRLLLRWNRQKNKREMPWKGEKDPYKIWLSEIILQQTRVEQGIEYYHRFIQKYPDIRQLAKANDKRIFKLWEGLGYYSRCRNLISTARLISQDLDGRFPTTFDDIRQLRGVGPYTAAAISSFAFNLPHAVIDGNVSRVLARVFGIKKPVDSTEGKKIIVSLAGELLDKNEPGVYNQAIMDFGAVICKPLAPLCSNCIFKKICLALEMIT
jgi:A/G-specific adenine glycosylase